MLATVPQDANIALPASMSRRLPEESRYLVGIEVFPEEPEGCDSRI
jgi:hypothetical protein